MAGFARISVVPPEQRCAAVEAELAAGVDPPRQRVIGAGMERAVGRLVAFAVQDPDAVLGEVDVRWLEGEHLGDPEAGAGDAVTVLLARDPAGHARLDDPGAVASLLGELREAGAGDAVTVLADRAANAGMFGLFELVFAASWFRPAACQGHSDHDQGDTGEHDRSDALA